jgi:hypothetical protein
MDWLYPLSGFVVGAIVGLTGMGGGSEFSHRRAGFSLWPGL